MKTKLLIIALLLPLLFSCKSKRAFDAVVEERDSLLVENGSSQAQLSEIKDYIDVLTTSLDSIAVEEGLLFVPDAENPNRPLTRKVIRERIDRFKDLVERQHERIKALEDSLSMNESAYDNIKVLITHYRQEIEKKDAEIDKMKRELASRNASIRKLETQVSELKSGMDSLQTGMTQLQEISDIQQSILKEQDEILNEGYYLVANRKQLVTSGIVKNSKLTGFMDLSLFERVNIKEFTSLKIVGSKPKILTPMPVASYTLTEQEQGVFLLDIIDPAEFWKVSNTLVIQTR